jgi:hypothetical protein
MAEYRVEASAIIDAPVERVYGIVADYRGGHPRILPPKYFTGLEVEQGGVGAGTVIRFGMKVLGQTRTLRATITEPEPGRVLVESDPVGAVVTTFTAEPLDGGRTRMTFSTAGRTAPGVGGWIEKWITTRMLPRIYRDELALLAKVAAADG